MLLYNFPARSRPSGLVIRIFLKGQFNGSHIIKSTYLTGLSQALIVSAGEKITLSSVCFDSF